MKNPTTELNKVLSVKLSRLSSFLHRSRNEFEKLVKRIGNRNVKNAIATIILETNQYGREVDAQLYCLGPNSVEAVDIKDAKGSSKVTLDNFEATTDNQMMDLFCREEINLEKEYRNILNEHFPYHGLRAMLSNQLNGIKCAFVQLKLLASVKGI